MAMPAFDMEPGSASASPDGNPSPPTPDDASAVAPSAVPEAAATKPASRQTAPTKSPTASLVSIAAKNKAATTQKSGDLTRLFEMARRQAPSASAEPLPSAEPAPIAVEPSVQDSLPDPQPMPIETAVAEAALELETAPEPSPVEWMGFVEPPVVSEPALDVPAEAAVVEPPPLSPIAAADADPAEPLSVVLAPADDASASLETPSLRSEPAAPPARELARDPEPAPAAAITPAAPLTAPMRPAAPATTKFVELAEYWRSLRSGDDHPAAESIDHDFVTMRWPGSLLIAYTPASQDPRGEPRPGRVTRLGTASAEIQNAIDAGSHSTEWMLEVARTALVNDEPVEEQQRLATLTGDASFRMVALPLGPPKGPANAVLCRLLPSPGAPRFGKRRIWL